MREGVSYLEPPSLYFYISGETLDNRLNLSSNRTKATLRDNRLKADNSTAFTCQGTHPVSSKQEYFFNIAQIGRGGMGSGYRAFSIFQGSGQNCWEGDGLSNSGHAGVEIHPEIQTKKAIPFRFLSAKSHDGQSQRNAAGLYAALPSDTYPQSYMTKILRETPPAHVSLSGRCS